MLSMAGRVPIHPRDLAAQRIRRVPLLEALIAIFINRLLSELRRGRHHAYVTREEDLPCLRGKLLIDRHVRRNVAKREQLHVAYDEFTDDTRLNQILKAATRRLLSISASPPNQQRIREALIELADVTDRTIRADEFDRMHLNRATQRFQDLVDFARLVLLQRVPSPTHGRISAFSLLFPMEQLFEEFIGVMIRRHAERFGFNRQDVHLQASGRKRWLLRESRDGRRFQLRPDVVVDGEDGVPRLILDTKWKRLRADEIDRRNGVARSDIYQLYAYTNRYACPDSVLLYPAVAGATAKTYTLEDDPRGLQIRTAFIDVSRDLMAERREFLDDLCDSLRPSSLVS